MCAIKYGLFSLLVLFMILNVCYAADELYLSTGDRLTGTITQVTNEYIVIDTVFAKQIKIKHLLITEVIMEQEVKIVFKDGIQKDVLLNKRKGEAMNYQINNQTFPLDLANLASEPEKVTAARESNVDYKGSLDVGLSKSSGNNDEDDYHVALMAQARTLKNRYTLEASKTIEKNDGDKTQDETYASLQYDRFFSDRWYGYIDASYEEDLEELLNLRSTYSLGSGYEFYNEDNLKLNAELGLAYVDEDFKNNPDNSYAGGRWAFNYEQAWLNWLSFYHNHKGFFSIEDSEDINIRSSTGFKLPLNDYINAKLEANIDWDRSPAEGATGTDKEYIFTLGYEF